MRDNIMFYPAIILMIVEVCAVVFLIRAWFRANRRGKKLPDGSCRKCILRYLQEVVDDGST